MSRPLTVWALPRVYVKSMVWNPTGHPSQLRGCALLALSYSLVLDFTAMGKHPLLLLMGNLFLAGGLLERSGPGTCDQTFSWPQIPVAGAAEGPDSFRVESYITNPHVPTSTQKDACTIALFLLLFLMLSSLSSSSSSVCLHIQTFLIPSVFAIDGIKQ